MKRNRNNDPIITQLNARLRAARIQGFVIGLVLGLLIGMGLTVGYLMVVEGVHITLTW